MHFFIILPTQYAFCFPASMISDNLPAFVKLLHWKVEKQGQKRQNENGKGEK
jgi:hypothetical protein